MSKYVYCLNITGTTEWDCKKMFSSEDDLNDYLRELINNRVFVVKETTSMGERVMRTVELTYQLLINWWDKHITIVKINTARLTNYQKCFLCGVREDGQADQQSEERCA